MTELLPPWPRIARPDEDILAGRFDESVFAAKLWDVHFGTSQDLDYQDPERFFKKTALTSGLSDFLSEVLSRLAGKRGTEPVTDLLSSFGGGKTHAMIAIRHLAVAGPAARDWLGVSELIEKAGVESVPQADVAVLVGDVLDPRDGHEGRLTMWGEMAFQLAGKEGYEVVSGHDQDRIAPSSDKLAQVLTISGNPKLILIDELIHYISVARAKHVSVGESSLATQTYDFIRALSEAVTKVPRCSLVATLPASVLEMGREDVEDYGRLKKVLQRQERTRQLSEGDEIYDIVRRRLFEDPGPAKTIRQVAGAFVDYYRRSGESFPEYASRAEYAKRIERAYPFHPALLDLLHERWESIPDFQRTRGVLRLLALLIGALYREDSTALILPASAKLSFRDFRAEALHQAAADAQFMSVIESDIAGTGGRAKLLDERGNETYQREHVAEGVATAALFFSFGGGAQIGATLAEMRLAVCRPGLEPAFVSDAIDLLHKRALHYLHEDAGRYYFTVTPNLTAVRVSFEENIQPEEVQKAIKEAVESAVGTSPFKVFLFPDPAEVVDQPSLALAVAPFDRTLENGGRAWANEVITGGGNFRVHKNAVSVLLPHSYEDIWAEIRSLLALQAIERMYGKAKEFRESQRRDLGQLLADARRRVPQSIWGAYRHVFCAGPKDVHQHFDLGRQLAREGETLAKAVWDRLVEEERLAPSLGPSQLLSDEVWPADRSAISLRTMAEAFTRYPFLPMVPSLEVVRSAARRGVEEGVFGYGIGDGKDFERVWLGQAADVELSENAWLLRRDLARRLLPDAEKELVEEEAIRTKSEGEPPSEEERDLRPGYRILRGSGSLTMDRWREFYADVIRPLVDAGAEVQIEVRFEARSSRGIPTDTVDLIVKENLRQTYGGDVAPQENDDA